MKDSYERGNREIHRGVLLKDHTQAERISKMSIVR
jgi:hypothetical protein